MFFDFNCLRENVVPTNNDFASSEMSNMESNLYVLGWNSVCNTGYLNLTIDNII